jgi:putative inorganic carbon (HCO3(-)) transporter
MIRRGDPPIAALDDSAQFAVRVRAALLDLLLLGLSAPLLYFPDRVPGWGPWVGVGLLALQWPLRRALTGAWVGRGHSGWVRGGLAFWFLVMLPVALWAAPPPLREIYAVPRALILVWNFHLFWSILAHAGADRRILAWTLAGWVGLVQAIAVVAPFGLEPRAKLPGIGPILDAIPKPLVGVFAGAEGGFSSNQVAGTLLYVLPLLLAAAWAGLRGRAWSQWCWWVIVVCAGWMGAVLLLTQSRGGLLGLALGVMAMGVLARVRRGWWVLGGLCLVAGALFFVLPEGLTEVISDAPAVQSVGGVVTVQHFRAQVWQAARWGLADFAFTGMGLGTFRKLVYLLYPTPGIPPTYDLAHAHNFFLQTGLDFGLPGLAAILLLYGAALGALWQMARRTHPPLWPTLPWLTPRVLAIGWMGSMVGQTFYSLFDAVAMGSKPNFVWWAWLALILAAGVVVRMQQAR